jgi:ferredoxin
MPVAAGMAERLKLNPAACDGVGICAHLAARLISVDTWGYPILSQEAVRPDTARQARAAISACPRHALFVTDDNRDPR